MLFTMVQRARALCKEDSFHDEYDFLKVTLRKNDYSDYEICEALYPPVHITLPSEDPVITTFNCTGRVMFRREVSWPPAYFSWSRMTYN